MKRYLILVLALILTLTVGCSSKQADSTTVDDNDFIEEDYAEEIEEVGMTLEEAKEADGSYFIKKGDKYFEPTYPEIVDADSTYINRNDLGIYGMGINFILNKEEENIPPVLEGDAQLVNVDQFSELEATNIEGDTGYTIPHLFSKESQGWQMWQEQYGNAYHGTISGQIGDIREVNGEDPDQTLSKCINCYMTSSLGYDIQKLLPMEKDEIITIGSFNGTDFEEESFTAQYSYFIPENVKYTTLDCAETKEGYGVINTSILSKGLYCFEDNSSGLRHYFWLEIK